MPMGKEWLGDGQHGKGAAISGNIVICGHRCRGIDRWGGSEVSAEVSAEVRAEVRAELRAEGASGSSQLTLTPTKIPITKKAGKSDQKPWIPVMLNTANPWKGARSSWSENVSRSTQLTSPGVLSGIQRGRVGKLVKLVSGI